MSHFLVKSGKSATFAPWRRLTAGLPDVGTDGVLHRNLIRQNQRSSIPAQGRVEIAFKAPSLRYQSSVRTETAKGHIKDRPGWGLRNTGREASPASAIHLSLASGAGWARAQPLQAASPLQASTSQVSPLQVSPSRSCSA